MTVAFAALAGTYLLTLDSDRVIRTPIIGWVAQTGDGFQPIDALGLLIGMDVDLVIQTPDGMVTTDTVVYANSAEWLNVQGIAHSPDRAEVVENKVVVDEAGPGPRPIEFGEKSYATTSFWEMPDQKAVFYIVGGNPYPKDKRCTKITRTAYADRKRDGWTAIDADGLVQPAGEPAPEEAEVEPEAEVEDDDIGDLV